MAAVFAERIDKTIRNLLKRPVFEKGYVNWIDLLSVITEQYNNRVHTSTNFTPIQASLKMNEWFVYRNLLDKRKKVNPQFLANDLVRVADLKKFSKADTTN